eukprot:TRINITY_DN10080_c0_g1_i1.p1 TRINITY_DN10080_c0_g1~~TRINITY_DN10080_c0_g1_i1.p1  ORF type:complete len:532 (-),score=83.97 TRINITY_DN10080_c0_g1_i1:636-2231(-)
MASLTFFPRIAVGTTRPSPLCTEEKVLGIQSSSMVVYDRKFKGCGDGGIRITKKREERFSGGKSVSKRGNITVAAAGDTGRVAVLPSWEQLQNSTADYFDAKKPREGVDRKVILYRDTNAWCPFCTRVWLALEEKGIPYETVLIDLSNKPKWYTDMVPTTLVPAIKIEDRLVWESADIIWALEEEFPDTGPLIPAGRESDVRAVLAKLDPFFNGPFFAWIFNTDAEKEEEMKKKSLETFEFLESVLADKPDAGPFLFGQFFSLADAILVTPLEGITHRIEFTKKLPIRGHPRYPHITAWFDALDLRPSFQAVRADARTSNLVLNYFVHRMAAANKPPPLWGSIPTELSYFQNYASNGHIHTENGAFIAAARMSHNKEKVIVDCFQSASVRIALGLEPLPVLGGRTTPAPAPPSLPSSVELAIDAHLRLFNLALLHEAGRGDSIAEAFGSAAGIVDLVHKAGQQLPEAESEESKAGVAAIKHLMQRVCVPRDMTAGAKVRFVEIAAQLVELLTSRGKTSGSVPELQLEEARS